MCVLVCVRSDMRVCERTSVSCREACSNQVGVVKNVTFSLGGHVTTGPLREHHGQGGPEGAIQEFCCWQLETELETVSGPHAILTAPEPWLGGHRAFLSC